jgi:four helix bundle protein
MAGSYKDLIVYQKAFELAMEIFALTKTFPPEEKYALTDQLRRSSRSICRAIGEGYRKRQYLKYFSHKMSDADMENTETQISLDFSLSCGYIAEEAHAKLIQKSEEIGKILAHMIDNPEKFLPKKLKP